MAQCPTHPGAEAIDTCTRCGRFFCAPERFELDGLYYCGDCGAREDLDWLGHHYRKLEGRRSGLAWVLLGLGLAQLVFGLSIIVKPQAPWRDVVLGLAVLVYGAACALFFTGHARARPGLVLGSFVSSLAFLVGTPDGFLGLIPALLTIGLTAAAWRDVRSKLFYRKPVPRLTLYAHFHREGSNPMAVTASRLAVQGLFVPGVSVVSLVLAVVALTRVDPKAVPPVGNRSAAAAALFLSVLMSAFWGSVLSERLGWP